MFLKSKYIAGLLTTVTVASGFGYLPNSESGMDTWKQNLGYELNVFHPETITGFDQKLESLKSDKEVDSKTEKEEEILTVSSGQAKQTNETKESDVTKEKVQKLSEEEMSKLKSYFKTRAVVDEDKVEGYLNIRSEASSEDTVEILGKLYPGAVAKILEEGKDWSRIESGDVIGWVKNSFLIFGDEAAEAVEEDATYKAEVQIETLNVRSGAGTDYDVMAIVEQGDKLEVVEEEDGWVQVKLNEDETGYVSEKYVNVDYDFPTAVSLEEEQAEYEAAWNMTEDTNWESQTDLESGNASDIAEETASQQAAAEEAARQQAAAEEAARQQAAAEEAARQQAAAEEAARQQAAAEEAARQQAAAEAAASQAAAEAAKKKYLGSFRITYYCPCTKCCGSWGTDTPGATVVGSSGQQLIAGYSVAVNPAQIPYGTKLLINGKTYIAADSGVGSNCIDIFSASHADALQGGMYYADVYIQ